MRYIVIGAAVAIVSVFLLAQPANAEVELRAALQVAPTPTKYSGLEVHGDQPSKYGHPQLQCEYAYHNWCSIEEHHRGSANIGIALSVFKNTRGLDFGGEAVLAREPTIQFLLRKRFGKWAVLAGVGVTQQRSEIQFVDSYTDLTATSTGTAGVYSLGAEYRPIDRLFFGIGYVQTGAVSHSWSASEDSGYRYADGSPVIDSYTATGKVEKGYFRLQMGYSWKK